MPDLVNPSFEDGINGWTVDKHPSGTTIDALGAAIGTAGATNGTYACELTNTSASDMYLLQDAIIPAYPGLSITASCDYSQGTASAGHNVGRVCIAWYDSTGSLLSFKNGNQVNGGPTAKSSVTDTAPANTAGVRVGLSTSRNRSASSAVDNFQWNYTYSVSGVMFYPISGSTYTIGSLLPLQCNVTVSGKTSVSSIEYFADSSAVPTVTTSLGSTTGTTNSDGTVSYFMQYDTTNLPADTYQIYAKITDSTGNVTTVPYVQTKIVDPVPPAYREFDASNSMLPIAFSGWNLTNPINNIATATAVQLFIDGQLLLITRAKDKTNEAQYSDTGVFFDVCNSVNFVVNLAENDDSAITSDFVYNYPFAITDFTEVESGISEGMRYKSYVAETTFSLTIGDTLSLFGNPQENIEAFLTKRLLFRVVPVITDALPTTADFGDAVIRTTINDLRIAITYDGGTTLYYVFNPSSGQITSIEMANYSVDDGSLQAGTATGTVQFMSSWTVNDSSLGAFGDSGNPNPQLTLHVATPPDATNQIAILDGWSANTLPSRADIETTNSRYEILSYNFYGDANRYSMYGVNGYGRAWTYNPNNQMFFNIQTQPDADKDRPRHIATHQYHLALGYEGGNVDISVIGSPYDFSGLNGASSFAIGEPLTGLTPLSGTLLGMFGNNSVWALSGTTVDNFATQVVLPKRGAIEYSVCDMGSPIFANSWGIYSLTQAQQYGDYLGVPLSELVTPWLRNRLYRGLGDKDGIKFAYPVRRKNQYRLVFDDGYQITMSMNGASGVPTFSIQKFETLPFPPT